IKALEEFRSDIGYEGKIEEVNSKKQNLTTCSVMKKPVDILNPKVYFDLNQVVNRKLKTFSAIGLGEKNRADELTLNEVNQNFEHPIMQKNTSEGLL
ncbi:9254_t:CDS:2, partial [Cetraspora pellucida]